MNFWYDILLGTYTYVDCYTSFTIFYLSFLYKNIYLH